jgi:putative MATE family efflux protein
MYSNKAILSLSYPIFLTLLAQSIVNVTDSAFLGRIGEVELGASALGGVFYMAVFVVGMGFTTGAQILMGRRNGEKEFARVGEVFNQGILFSIVLACFVFVISYWLAAPFLRLFIHSQAIYVATVTYLNYRVFGFFFAFVNLMFRAFYVGIMRTKALIISGFVTMGFNVVFSYGLVFGHFGFSRMGIGGAALASVLAEAIAFLFFLFYTFAFVRIDTYRLFHFSTWHFQTIWKILDLSFFIMFQSFLSISTWFLFFIFIEKMGERALAVSNIIRSLYSLLGLPVITFGVAISTIVSNLIGEGKTEEVLPMIRHVSKLALLFMSPVILVTALFPRMFAAIYTNNIGLMNATIPSLHVFCLIMFVFAIGNIYFNAVSGTGNTRMALLFEVLVLVAYLTYIYLVNFVFHASVAIAWLSEVVYWVGIGLCSFWYLMRGNWRAKQL